MTEVMFGVGVTHDKPFLCVEEYSLSDWPGEANKGTVREGVSKNKHSSDGRDPTIAGKGTTCRSVDICQGL